MGMKGYKAFRHGFYCEVDGNRKQYQENSIAEDTGANDCCEEGVMHFCETPLDCLDYYPLIDDDGKLTEFAEVEALDEVHKNGNKRATKRLRIGAKLSIFKLGEIQANVMVDSVENYAQQVGGDAAKQVGGNYAKQVGGDAAKQVGGDSAQQVCGDSAKQVGGYSAKQVGGDAAKQVGGHYAQQVGGDAAKQVGGHYAQQVGGDSAQQVGGDAAKQVGGYYARQVGGHYAQQVGGHYAQQESGKNSIIVASNGSLFKTGLHSVVLRYWYNDNGDIAGFKAAQVDGTVLKPDTWYKLENGEFVEANL